MNDLLDFICGGSDILTVRSLLGFFVFLVVVNAIVLLCRRMGGLTKW